MENREEKTGFLVIDKPYGMTSRDVVNKVSHELGTKKIGHTGTLDPIATGVLVLLVGKCTKLCDDVTSTEKEYITEFTLGYETDTLDETGNVTKKSSVLPSEAEIKDAIDSFKGEYVQEIPLFSAVKINGKRLYEYARNNEPVYLPSRKVNIKNIEVLSIDGNNVKIRTLVSKGTYIRSLIRDIGVKLGTYATMNSLRRTKQGKFNIEESIEVGNDLVKSIRPIEELIDVEIINLSDEAKKKIENGVPIEYDSIKDFLLYKYENENIALYHKEDRIYKMYIKF